MIPDGLNPATLLVIQLARFGDFLQTTPLLAALKARYPNSRLTVLVNSDQAGLAETNPNIDKILTVNLGKLAAVAQSEISLPKKLKYISESIKTLKKQEYDLLINLNTSRIAALLGSLIPAKKREGSHFGQDRKRLLTAPWTGFIMNLMTCRRLIRFNLVDLLTTYAGNGAQPSKGLTYPLTFENTRLADNLLGSCHAGPLIGYQLGSRHETRQWPAEYFAALGAKQITEDGAQLVLIGTDAERSLAEKFMAEIEQIKPQAKARILNLMGQTTIPALAGVLDRLDLLVTTDTGSMHLAAAVGTPILALFMGPAYCHETGPYGPGHLIIQTVTDCSPCTENESRCSNAFCRYLIKPELVFSMARYLLKKTAAPCLMSETGPHVRLLVSGVDSFGTIYKPLVPWRLDNEEILATAYREAGRSFMRAGYRLDQDKLLAEFKSFESSELSIAKNISKSLNLIEKLLQLKQDQKTIISLKKITDEEPNFRPLIKTVLLPHVSAKAARLMIQNMNTVISTARSSACSLL
ncbi:MAG: glycosyltransferase family 9 protein [Deltaproteobacteria bacterium]|nr:glycosyltransferase family 9 protein [Deltaproteobacteria bacterium]